MIDLVHQFKIMEASIIGIRRPPDDGKHYAKGKRPAGADSNLGGKKTVCMGCGLIFFPTNKSERECPFCGQ